MSEEKCCGTCEYHYYGITGAKDWCCNNGESDNYGCYTEYSDTCEEWEER